MKIAEKFKLKGNELYKKKKYHKALKYFDNAIEAFPFDGYYYSNKAQTLIKLQ